MAFSKTDQVEIVKHDESPRQRRVILIVDDDPSILMLLNDAFSSLYDVLTARSVAEAEPLLRNRQVEVLVCDDTMPGETGLMFMARIRNEFPFTRRILLTGNIDPDILIYAINEAALYRFVVKPFQIGELKRLIAEGIDAYADERTAGLAARENKRLNKELDRQRETGSLPAAPTLGRRARIFLGWWLILVAFFAIGIVMLLTLYLLKSFLGIDFFQDVHFKDLFG